jgi:hypothetical protein
MRRLLLQVTHEYLGIVVTLAICATAFFSIYPVTLTWAKKEKTLCEWWWDEVKNPSPFDVM